jgi:TPR repeat protein
MHVRADPNFAMSNCDLRDARNAQGSIGMQKVAILLVAIGVALAAIASVGAAEIAKGVGVSGSVFRAAELGDPKAQTAVGFMYETGRGLPQDYMLAVSWYRRAAEQGYARAQHLLGLMYDKGQGVAEDYIAAHKWLNLAAAGAGAREREYYVRIRNALAYKMTVAQITEAQWRARHWRPVPER